MENKNKKSQLTFFVARYISTTTCLTRLAESGEKGTSSAVKTPDSSCHEGVDEKKLKGKNLSTSIFTALISRTLKKGGMAKHTTAASNWEEEMGET